MATREENIKKINDELEQLSDEELDNVAGGAGIINIPKKDSQPLWDENPDDFFPNLHPKTLLDTPGDPNAVGLPNKHNPNPNDWSPNKDNPFKIK